MTHDAYEISGHDRKGRWLITCDHASNRVPDWVHGGDLGLPAPDMERHIAYDVGAAGVSLRLAELLDSPAILSRFSRLVMDPNRGPDDPTRLMRLYDGTIIPANAYASADAKAEREARLYDPYHAAVAELAAVPGRVFCAVHSFTPKLRGRSPRPWQVGVLYAAQDGRIAKPLIAACEAAGWCTGENEPYAGHLPGDSVDRHALQHGRPNVLIELRHDLISDAEGQNLWAERLAPILADVLAQSGL